MATKQRKKPSQAVVVAGDEPAGGTRLPRDYRRACRLAGQGRTAEARRLYEKLAERETTGARVRALARNDLAVLEALAGRADAACGLLREVLATEPECQPARLNLALLEADLGGDGAGEVRPTDSLEAGCAVGGESTSEAIGISPELSSSGPDLRDATRVTDSPSPGRCASDLSRGERFRESSDGVRVALVSFLFNWPATGGGNVHTVELARFLGRAGYQVRHVFPRYAAWAIGRVGAALDVASEALEFDDAEWNVPAIQRRLRAAVDGFAPDCVLITDAWNMKPLLAEAVRDYPYFLRFQALECLCPLNNLRLLAEGPDQVEQCPRHQLATAELCHRCVAERSRQSGPLHQIERALAGVGTPEYDRALRRALEEAEAVLVLNPLTQAMLSPYARRVCVVPWGMDPARFPGPPSAPAGGRVVRLFMAAVAGEFIKGFHVLHEACRRLRQARRDFELVVTFDPPGPIDEFTRSVGWVSQEELPRHYRDSDVCVVPTIAQEGLSRTSVEAMASARPVIASRIGGLPFTVSDGVTGLLFEPGDVEDLARKIAVLLDDPALRERMGVAGRMRFEREFTWDAVIETHYRPLLEPLRHGAPCRDGRIETGA